jgi:hypothetical protein
MTANPAWFAPVTPAIRMHTCRTKALPPVATTLWLSPTSPSLPNMSACLCVKSRMSLSADHPDLCSGESVSEVTVSVHTARVA